MQKLKLKLKLKLKIGGSSNRTTKTVFYLAGKKHTRTVKYEGQKKYVMVSHEKIYLSDPRIKRVPRKK